MVVVVFGLPGTGKTYFSERLAGETGMVHLDTDKIRKKLGKEDKYDQQTKLNVYDQLLKEMVQSLRQAEDVILDGTFYKRSIREKIANKAGNLNKKMRYIEIKADEKVIRKRLKKSRDHSEADYEVYLKIKKSFEPLNESHLILWSRDDNIEEMIEEAKIYIYG